MQLILYSKPGCHLCEGLQEKLEQIQGLAFELEVRDITTRQDWFQKYQYEVPVLCRLQFPHKTDLEAPEHSGGEAAVALPAEQQLPRLSPRASVLQLEKMLQKYLN